MKNRLKQRNKVKFPDHLTREQAVGRAEKGGILLLAECLRGEGHGSRKTTPKKNPQGEQKKHIRDSASACANAPVGKESETGETVADEIDRVVDVKGTSKGMILGRGGLHLGHVQLG